MPAERAFHLTDRVKLDLLRLIEAGKLGPGAKLPPADQLCEQFQVSRTVVREAIANLKAVGMVSTRQGLGAFVLRDAAILPFRIEESTLEAVNEAISVLEVRISLESEAAYLAAIRRTETNLLRMGEALAQFRRHMHDNTLATDADRAFHRAIADATMNARFRLFVDEMGSKLIPRRALGARFVDEASKAGFLANIETEHLRILEAITERRPDEARLAMRRHLEDGRRRYREWRLAQDLAPLDGA